MAAGAENPRDLAERLGGVARVLENLRAEHEVERRVGDLELLDRADVGDVRARLDVRSDVLLGRGPRRAGSTACRRSRYRGSARTPRRSDCAPLRGFDERAVVEVVRVDEPGRRSRRCGQVASQSGSPRSGIPGDPTALPPVAREDEPRRRTILERCDSRPRSQSAWQWWRSGLRSAGAGSPASLTWAPPALSNPIAIDVTNANRRLFLDDGRDYRLNIVEPLKRELWIEGGRNVVVIGGHITVDELGAASSYQDNTAVKVRFGDPAGTVHLEGLLIDGPLRDRRHRRSRPAGTSRSRTSGRARVRHVKGGHADCVQIQRGSAQLRMDRFTCTTRASGHVPRRSRRPDRRADLRRVDLTARPGSTALADRRRATPWSSPTCGSASPRTTGRGRHSATGCIRSETDGTYAGRDRLEEARGGLA